MATEVTKLKKDSYDCEECVIVPAVDIYETVDEYVLKADMPGVQKEDLDITFEKNQLEINGKVDSSLVDDENIRYREYTLYNYNRRFTVGEGIDSQKIAARLEDGVLTLTLPKSEAVKPRKIEVKSE